MNKRWYASAALLALSVTCVRAETRELTLPAVVAEALDKSPAAAEIDSGLAARMAEAFAAEVKDNPVLSVSVDLPSERPPGGGIEQEDVSVTLSQALRPSDFGARAELAVLMRNAGTAEKILSLNEYVQNVTSLYIKTWKAQERQRVIQKARERSQSILSTAKGAVTGGLVSEGDTALLTGEVKSLEAELEANAVEWHRAKAELVRLTTITMENTSFARPVIKAMPSRDEVSASIRDTQLPLQRRYQSLVQVARKQLEVARLDSNPTLTPHVGYGRHDDGTDQVLVGLSIPLPIFNRNQAEEMKAQGALSAAERGQTYATSDSILAEVLLLVEASEGLAKQVALFTSGVVTSKERAVEAYTRQFNSGIGNVFQIWQAQRDLNESRLKTLELESARLLLHAQISALLGYSQF